MQILDKKSRPISKDLPGRDKNAITVGHSELIIKWYYLKFKCIFDHRLRSYELLKFVKIIKKTRF